MADARVAWITGASSGIGAALAHALADAGWQVAVSARRADALDSVCAHDPERIRAYPLDVTDASAAADVVAAITRDLGPIDRAVLNAGIGRRFKVSHFDAAEIEHCMAVNYGGTVNALAAVLPGMRERGRGQLALMASLAGYRGLPKGAPYVASKAAVIALAESLRIDLHGTGVDVRVICPGYVHTPMTEGRGDRLPLALGVEDAARRIRHGLDGKGFEIAFPRRLAWLLKTLRCLPPAAYFALMRRVPGV